MGEDPAAAHPGGPNAPRKSSIPAGGFAGINARTREMAAAKLPPRLQAKLSENARISALTSGPPSSTMKHDEKLDSSLLMPKMPSTAPRPASKWDALDYTDADDAPPSGSGDAELNAFFQKLYADADPDTRRAMVKSFQESGGTALSTNWADVKDKTMSVRAPQGLEARRYEQ